MTEPGFFGKLLGDLGRRLLDQVTSGQGVGSSSPAGSSSGSHLGPSSTDVDRYLPSRVGTWPRTFVNNRFGGLDQGGIFAAYDIDGHPARVLVRRAKTTEAADRLVAEAPAGPGQAAWSEGAVWYSASGGSVEGDEEPTLGPGDVEALDRFVAAWRRGSGGGG